VICVTRLLEMQQGVHSLPAPTCTLKARLAAPLRHGYNIPPHPFKGAQYTPPRSTG